MKPSDALRRSLRRLSRTATSSYASDNAAARAAGKAADAALALDARILSVISQGVLIAGPDQKLLWCNEAFTRITGFDRDEIFEQDWALLQGRDSDPAELAAMRRAMDQKVAYHAVLLNYRKSQDPFWNQLSITPVADDAGRVQYFIGTVVDVTEAKQAETARQASELRYHRLMQHVAAGVVVHGPDSEILFANATASRLLGLSFEQLLGRVAIDPRWHFVTESGDPIAVPDYPVNRVLRSGIPVHNQIIGVCRPDRDRPVWVICNGYPVQNDLGRLTEVVISFADVTDLKQAEQALQKSEERLRLVLQGSTDALWDWDLLTDSLYYSPRWWQMLGYQNDELPSDSTLWRRWLHRDDLERVKDFIDRALADAQDSCEMEFRLRHKDGHYVPILWRAFILRDADGKPIRVSGTNTDLTERKQAEERIHQLAFYDALTGLPNRRLLMEQLRRALLSSSRQARQGALLFIDLDNFKVLNDTLGHDMGDRLLQQVAERLRDCVRETDLVARLGGDEFVVMLENLDIDPHAAALEAEMVAQKILSRFVPPFQFAGIDHRSTPSIGVALISERAATVDGLLKQADLAMYEAKAAGRNTLRFFDSSMQVAVDERLSMENELREALERDQLSLHYQPQVNQLGDVVGAEVLLRWQHPLRGLIPPGDFIPLAESTGLILPIGLWVLRTACTKLAAWSVEPRFQHLSLSVNVSTQQFHDPDFVNSVLRVLDETGANPAQLKMELTESLLAADIEEIIVKMSALKSHGIGFSLDDFGTGYSSLGYLRRLPLDQLKIDQSFVREVLTNPNDASIANIIISLAEKLSLSVIAEGVESEGQRLFLNQSGCFVYQGYLFGRPQAEADFETSIRGV